MAAGTATGRPTVFDLIMKQRDQIEMALPRHVDTDRFARIALTCVRTTPKLAECDAASLLGALMIAAQTGTEPGPPFGYSYLVPYNKQVQYILGYRGITKLAYQSGMMSSIDAHEVREDDDFDYRFGTDSYLHHKPAMGDRGKTELWYAVARFKDGGHTFSVLDRAEIDRHRKRSRATGQNTPWNTDFDAMARKTCIRVLAPYLPLSPELEAAFKADERVYRDIGPDMADMPALEAGGDGGDGEPPSDEDPPPPTDDEGRPFD